MRSGGVYLSGNTFEQVRGKTPFTFDDHGEKQLKNIGRPVRIYAAKLRGLGTASAVVSNVILDAKAPLPLPDKPSIAVLPFQNMSGDPEQEYFTDGMVEDVITALSRFKSLFVIARNSTFTYKGRAVDIKQVGRETAVRYVLEGIASERVQPDYELLVSLLTPRQAPIFGPTKWTESYKTSLTFKTGSRPAWSAWLRRPLSMLSLSAPSTSRLTNSTVTIFTFVERRWPIEEHRMR